MPRQLERFQPDASGIKAVPVPEKTHPLHRQGRHAKTVAQWL